MNPYAGAPRRAKLLGLATLAAAFLVGALAGAALSHALGASEPPRAAADRRGPRSTDLELFERLALTPEQRAQVHEILERRRAQMKAFWKEHGPYLRALVDSTRAEVRAVLTPAQRAEEERLWRERRGLHKNRRGPGPEPKP